jgi:sulfate transport system permease protein
MHNQTQTSTHPRLPVAWGKWGIRATAFSYLSILLVIPLLIIIQDGFSKGIAEFWRQVTFPLALSALWLTIWTSAVMTVLSTIFGFITAYVLVRYDFAGKRWLNAIIDLPLAIPTLVTGVMLVVLYGTQSALGYWLNKEWGWEIIFAPSGILLALLFTTFPFVVRTIQPALLEMDQNQESAAATLGANSWEIFTRVTLPPLILPLLSGAMLSFARAIGEFGSIVIVAGNIPFYSQTAAVYVFGEVESENRLGASALSVVMVGIAFTFVLITNWLTRLVNAPRGGIE